MSIFNILVFHLLFHIFHLYLHVLFPSTFIALFLNFFFKSKTRIPSIWRKYVGIFSFVSLSCSRDILPCERQVISCARALTDPEKGFWGMWPPSLWNLEDRKKNIFVNCMRYVYLVVHTRRYAMRTRYQYVVRMTYFIKI